MRSVNDFLQLQLCFLQCSDTDGWTTWHGICTVKTNSNYKEWFIEEFDPPKGGLMWQKKINKTECAHVCVIKEENVILANKETVWTTAFTLPNNKLVSRDEDAVVMTQLMCPYRWLGWRCQVSSRNQPRESRMWCTGFGVTYDSPVTCPSTGLNVLHVPVRQVVNPHTGNSVFRMKLCHQIWRYFADILQHLTTFTPMVNRVHISKAYSKTERMSIW